MFKQIPQTLIVIVLSEFVLIFCKRIASLGICLLDILVIDLFYNCLFTPHSARCLQKNLFNMYIFKSCQEMSEYTKLCS